jgi:hypothetical protein
MEKLRPAPAARIVPMGYNSCDDSAGITRPVGPEAFMATDLKNHWRIRSL